MYHVTTAKYARVPLTMVGATRLHWLGKRVQHDLQARSKHKRPCNNNCSCAWLLQEQELAPYRAATRARKESKDSFRAEFGDLEFRSERELDDAIKARLCCLTWHIQHAHNCSFAFWHRDPHLNSRSARFGCFSPGQQMHARGAVPICSSKVQGILDAVVLHS